VSAASLFRASRTNISEEFWGPHGVTGSDAAWGMVNGSMNAPVAAAAHHNCGDGILCKMAVDATINIAIGGVRGIVSAGETLAELALETRPSANLIASFRNIFNTNATFVREWHPQKVGGKV